MYIILIIIKGVQILHMKIPTPNLSIVIYYKVLDSVMLI